jgi:hypothetical protein
MTSADANGLAREEYDFSDVPEKELECCLYYEYLRESEAIIAQVKNVRQQMWDDVKHKNAKVGDKLKLNLTFTKTTKSQGMIFEAVLISTLAGSPPFPDVPWQKLSSSSKKLLWDFPSRAGRMHDKFFLEEHPRLVLEAFSKDAPALGDSTLNAWKAIKMPKRYKKLSAETLDELLISGFFQINTVYKYEYLVEAFRDWLKKNYPKGIDSPKERRGRDTERDPLNALGALRLRYHCRTLTGRAGRRRATQTSGGTWFGISGES